MAEFPVKLAIFGQNLPKNAASLREAARGSSFRGPTPSSDDNMRKGH